MAAAPATLKKKQAMKKEDFVTESNDKSNRRKKKTESTNLRRRLKNDAYLPIFTNLPSYYTYESERRRSGLSSSTSRHEIEAATLEKCCKSFLNADKLESFNDRMAKITEELPRQNYLLHHTNSEAYFIHSSEEKPSFILATIFINCNLEVAIYQKQLAVPFSAYKHIISSNKVTFLSQVINLMAFGKNVDQKSYSVVEQFQSKVNDLISDFLLNTENQQQI